MRFLFIDRVTGLERGRRITGIKSFAATEPFLESHFTRAALVPGVLLIEAMAQLLGWLASYTYDFRCVSVLALISDVTVPAALKPGARVEIDGRLLTTTERDSLAAAEGLEKEIVGGGGGARAYQADVSDSAAVDAMFGFIAQEYRRLDILVNNAGIVQDTLLLSMTIQDWASVQATNLTGAFLCTRHAV